VLKRQGQWVFVAAICFPMALVLSLPVFPSQDGPMHLYWVDVLRALLSHSNQYGGYFQIRAFLTPYALHYYTMLALEAVFSAEMSEKILLCIYICLFSVAFKYLVNSVTPFGGGWSLVALPFCLNSLIYWGFYNYSFGVTFTLFLVGFWIRWHDHLDANRIGALAAGLIVLLLTHPVPGVVLLSYIGIQIVVELLSAKAFVRPWSVTLRGQARKVLVLGGMALVTLVWIGRFLATPRNANPDGVGRIGGDWITTAILELKLWPVAPLTSGAYRSGLMAVLLLALVSVIAGMVLRWRHVASSGLVALCLTSLLCFLLYVFLPEWINGSGYFRERFPIFFVLFLLAAGAASAPSSRWSYAAGGIAVLALCSTGVLQWRRATEIATELRPLLTAEISGPLGAGVLLHERSPENPIDRDVTFDPYAWAGAHYFRRAHAVLLDTMGLDQPIHLLRPANPGPWDYLDPLGEANYFSTQEGCSTPRLDLVVRVGKEVPSGVADAVIGRYCLGLAARAGERLTVYTRRAGMLDCCESGPKTTK